MIEKLRESLVCDNAIDKDFNSLLTFAPPQQTFPLSLDVLDFSFSSRSLEILLVFTRLCRWSSFYR